MSVNPVQRGLQEAVGYAPVSVAYSGLAIVRNLCEGAGQIVSVTTEWMPVISGTRFLEALMLPVVGYKMYKVSVEIGQIRQTADKIHKDIALRWMDLVSLGAATVQYAGTFLKGVEVVFSAGSAIAPTLAKVGAAAIPLITIGIVLDSVGVVRQGYALFKMYQIKQMIDGQGKKITDFSPHELLTYLEDYFEFKLVELSSLKLQLGTDGIEKIDEGSAEKVQAELKKLAAKVDIIYRAQKVSLALSSVKLAAEFVIMATFFVPGGQVVTIITIVAFSVLTAGTVAEMGNKVYKNRQLNQAYKVEVLSLPEPEEERVARAAELSLARGGLRTISSGGRGLLERLQRKAADWIIGISHWSIFQRHAPHYHAE